MRISPAFVVITGVFISCLIVANIIAVKLVNIGGLVLPAAVIIFPLSYLFGDVLTEVYGFARARLVIWLGFACNALVVLAIVAAGALPAAGFWSYQAAYDRILGATPQILLASFLAYLVGEFANSYVMARLKLATKGRWLWTRTISSTLVGEGLDSLVFITIAFYRTPGVDIPSLIFTQWWVKSAYEIVATPLTYGIVGWLKRIEGVDHFDYGTDFNPLALQKGM
ncbi:MAG: queuosine precursor transporter [Chloroflexia bacterium]